MSVGEPREANVGAGRRWTGGGERITLIPIGLGLAFYAVFIGRTPFTWGGQRYFSLFDDAMISMRYGENLANGHGLVWNAAGDRVEGYSNFLWTLWMGVIHLLPIPERETSLAVMITGAALLCGLALVSGALAGLLAPENRNIRLAAVTLTAFYYPIVFWTLRGMEVALAALEVSLAALLVLKLRERFSGRILALLALTMALALLTRDDLIVPCVVIAGFGVLTAGVHRRRAALALFGTLIAVFAGHMAARLAYYGDPLPNTYYLKVSGVPIGLRLGRGVLVVAYSALTNLYAPLILAAAYLVQSRRIRQAGVWLLVVVIAAQCAYCVVVGGDAWENYRFPDRFLCTVAPLLLVLASVGTGKLLEGSGSGMRRTGALVFAAFLAVGLLTYSDRLPVERLDISPGHHLVGRVVLAAAAGAAIALAVGWARPLTTRVRGSAATRLVPFIIVIAAIAISVNGSPARAWLRDNAPEVQLDAVWARYGLVLKQFTAPSSKIAVTGAGNTPYFAHRESIDLLGKADKHVAHGPFQRSGPFRPGHSKWDYSYSIGSLRPDAIQNFWAGKTPAFLCRLQQWGYRQIAANFYVQASSSAFRPGFVTAIRAADVNPIRDPEPACR